jgi:putative ABC transport system permease protein
VGAEDIPFLVTGITHGMAADTYLTFDGIERIFPNFEKVQLMIYLYPGTNAALFIEDMDAQMGDRAFALLDFDAAFAGTVDTFASVFGLVGLVILILAAFIIILIMYFVLDSVIVRRYRDLGIQKALGFTTRNLMRQLSLAFSFPILPGTSVGTTLGILFTNSVMTAAMRPMGMRSNFIVNVPWAIIAGVSIILLSYCTSMLITWRIRNISAYRLVVE